MSYHWQHMENAPKRGEYLFKVLKPYLWKTDKVLDLACGYSPMAALLLAYELPVTGIDEHETPITYLTEVLPYGNWICEKIENWYESTITDYSVLLLLGTDTPQHTPEFQQFLAKLLEACAPRVILLETWIGHIQDRDTLPPEKGLFFANPWKNWTTAFNLDAKTILNAGYTPSTSGVYVSDLRLTKTRAYTVFEKKKSEPDE